MELDSAENIYLIGTTKSEDFPIINNSYDTIPPKEGYSKAFVLKIKNNLDSLLASTFLGGTLMDYGIDLDLSTNNEIFVCGYTRSPDFPSTPGAYNESYNHYPDEELYDIFISKFDSELTTLKHSTFLGGNHNERCSALTLDKYQNIYVVGFTQSTNFPVTSGAYDISHNAWDDGFVCKFDSSLHNLLSSTLFGGESYDRPKSIALDENGNIYIGGTTNSVDFPISQGAFDDTHNGNYDGFVFRIDTGLKHLKSSTFLGGQYWDIINYLAFNQSGNLYIAGSGGPDYPTTENAYYKGPNGGGLITFIDINLSDIYASTIFPGRNSLVEFDFDKYGNIVIVGETYSPDLPITSGSLIQEYIGGSNYFYTECGDGYISKLDADLSIDPNQIIKLMEDSDSIIINIFPNPFKNIVQINYKLKSLDFVKISIYNTSGKLIKTLVSRNQKPGIYIIQWDGTNEQNFYSPNGIYYCVMKTSRKNYTRRIIYLGNN
ncbi:hypothetical protein ES708_18269 [subsurface metagenome]